MSGTAENGYTSNRDFLSEAQLFQRLPHPIQRWVLASPHAAADFADFLRNGGAFVTDQKIGLPLYSPEPPRIFIDKATYAALKGPHAEELDDMQRAVFSTLAHEIGHDKENTANRLFPESGTEVEFIRYRADLEAKATFNAFPIFADLAQSDPTFIPDWNRVGYLAGMEIKPLYDRWLAGEDEEKVINDLSARIPYTSYTLSNPPPDFDHDGRITHRDGYIRDYREQRERIKNFQQHRMDPKPDQDDLSHPTPEPPTHQDRLDPHNPGHPDHSLYDTLRRQLPPQTSDDMVAHVMLQAKIGGVLNVGELDKVIVRDDRVFVMGVTPGFRTDVYLSQTPPPIHETFQRSEDFDRQRAQDHAQWLAQETQLSQGRGMRHSL